MGNIGSHVDLTSGWAGHQANAEAEGAFQRNWCHGLLATGIHKRLPTSKDYSDSLFAGVRRASAGVRITRPCRNFRRVFGDLPAGSACPHRHVRTHTTATLTL